LRIEGKAFLSLLKLTKTGDVMRKLILLVVLLFASIGQQPAFATSTSAVAETPKFIEECSINVNPDIVELLRPVIEKMGIEVDQMEVVEQEVKDSCTIRIKGTIDGKKENITITIEGKSCAELVKDLM
jgi:UDP-N-acetyl-D-mannosaminuronate dehydrogenase